MFLLFKYFFSQLITFLMVYINGNYLKEYKQRQGVDDSLPCAYNILKCQLV